MKNKKILITIISLFALILMMIIPSISLASSSCTFKVQIIQPRSDNMCYSINDGSTIKYGTKRIWNHVHVIKESPLEYDKVDHLYCVDASRDGYKYPYGSPYSYVETYNIKYDFKKDKRAVLNEAFKDNNSVKENYHYLLGLYDIMYNPGDAKEKEYKKQLLEAAGLKENDLTDGAISAVQQAALWYYTNNDNSFYNLYDGIKSKGMYENLYTAKYEAGKTDLANMKYTKASQDLQTKFGKLYLYLIDTSKNIGKNVYKSKDVDVSNVKEYPIEINKKNAEFNSTTDGYKYGPLKITKRNALPYSLEISVKDGTNNLTYKLLNDKNEEIKDINKYTGDLYVKVTTEDINKVDIEINETYQLSKITVYHNTTKRTLQPMSEFVKENKSKKFTFSANAPKEFDLALRKYITAVNGKKLQNDYIRDLDNIDVASLASGDDTTAIYKHTKKPVPVEEGNTVTYSIKIYNEGQQAGRATEITDQLPTGLELKTTGKVTSEKGNEYSVEYDKTTNRVVLTNEGRSNLSAFNDKILDSETITLDCIVTAKKSTEKEQVLTNIAWISKEYNADTDSEIKDGSPDIREKDRDSKPSLTAMIQGVDNPVPTKDNMENYYGYGKSWLEDANYFYIGTEDDDDFEKLVLPQKITGKYSVNIVKVDNELNNPLAGAGFVVNDRDISATDDKGIAIVEKDKIITEDGQTAKYIIEEKTSPSGYERFKGKIVLEVTTKSNGTKYVVDNAKTSMKVYDRTGAEITNNIPVTINKEEGLITLTVKNSKAIEGKYGLRISKIDNKDKDPLEGVTFNINGTDRDTDKKGIINIEKDKEIKKTGEVAKYTIEEKKTLEGYEKFDGKIELTVVTKIDGENYVLDTDNTTMKVYDKDGKEIKNSSVQMDIASGLITITIENKTERTGKYGVKIVKVDSKNKTPLKGAIFTVDGSDKNATNDDGTTIIENEKVITKEGQTQIYNIEEKTAPDGYSKFDGKIRLEVKTTSAGGRYIVDVLNSTMKVYDKEGKEINNAPVSINKAEELITITVEDSKEVKGDYSLRIVKADENKNPLEGATFTVNNVDASKTDTKGITIIENKKSITKEGKIQTYSIKEKTAPNGYLKFDGTIELIVVSKIDNEKYVIDKQNTIMKVYDKNNNEVKGELPVNIDISSGLITITVENNLIEGSYGVKLIKEDENGENLKDPAIFEVTNKQTGKTETKTTKDSKLDITNGAVQITEENVNKPDVYVIKETKAPDKYCEFNGIITLTVTKENVNGKYKVKSYDYQVTDKDGKNIKDEIGNTVAVTVKDGNIYVNVRNYQFDLALRKFIVQVNDTKLKTADGKEYLRAPAVDTSKLNTTDEKNNKITTAIYNHPKTPVEVKKGDTVIYMLRVYNEGDVDGYATEIKDHLPSYLEFVKGDFNTKYKWQVSEDGRTVTSTYLENQLIIKPTMDEYGKIVKLSYKEVPIMCKVKDIANTNEAITNIADITKCKDKNKKEVTDRDSNSDNVEIPKDEELPKYKEGEKGQYVPGQEDDDDFEKVIIYKFDLALRKWVTQAIVIENDKQKVTNTKHDAWDDPEDVVKVELHRKKLDNVTVKFKYSIRVYNQGDIEGYAKEITDYIPEGLKFVAEDNPNWKDEGNNVISTRLLEDTLLKPGEYADVEVVLTWINGKDNVGLKVNTAEISEDYNDKGVPDIDSTPDNKVPGEDDIDDAPVLLAVETGKQIMYIGLGVIILSTLAGGVVLIKKYVL